MKQITLNRQSSPTYSRFLTLVRLVSVFLASEARSGETLGDRGRGLRRQAEKRSHRVDGAAHLATVGRVLREMVEVAVVGVAGSAIHHPSNSAIGVGGSTSPPSPITSCGATAGTKPSLAVAELSVRVSHFLGFSKLIKYPLHN